MYVFVFFLFTQKYIHIVTTVKGSEFEFSIKEGNVYSQRLNPFILAPGDQTTQ